MAPDNYVFQLQSIGRNRRRTEGSDTSSPELDQTSVGATVYKKDPRPTLSPSSSPVIKPARSKLVRRTFISYPGKSQVGSRYNVQCTYMQYKLLCNYILLKTNNNLSKGEEWGGNREGSTVGWFRGVLQRRIKDIAELQNRHQ